MNPTGSDLNEGTRDLEEEEEGAGSSGAEADSRASSRGALIE